MTDVEDLVQRLRLLGRDQVSALRRALAALDRSGACEHCGRTGRPVSEVVQGDLRAMVCPPCAGVWLWLRSGGAVGRAA